MEMSQRRNTRQISPRSHQKKNSRSRNQISTVLSGVGPVISVFGATDPLPGGSLAFEYSLAQLPGVAQYSQLFDLYKIDWVELEFVPTSNMSAVINATEPPGGTNPAYLLPCLHTALDFSNASSPLNVATVMTHATYRRAWLTKPYRRRFTGHARVAVANPGGSTPLGYQSLTSAHWFETSGPSLDFGTLVCFVDPCSTSSVALTPMKIQTFVKFHVTFKNIQ